MHNLKKNTYVMVEFTVLDWVSGDLVDNKIKERMSFTCPPIVEIAAVKIQNGKICEYYTNFIGLDGLNAENLSDDGDCMSHFGITPAHLIGAPSFKEVLEKFFHFSENCIILVRHKTSSYHTPFDIFQIYAKSYGYIFNNPVFGMTNIVQAVKVKEMFEDKEQNIDYTDILRIAKNLDHSNFWTDTFAEYEIFFNPDSKESFDKGRNDPLSWALALARLFIAITDCKNDDENVNVDTCANDITPEESEDGEIPF